MREQLISKRFEFAGDGDDRTLSDRAQAARARFLEKQRAGQYRFKEVPCVCGSREDVVISRRDRHGLSCQNVVCQNCGLIRINPRLDQDSYAKFYNEDYRDLYMGPHKDSATEWESLARQGEEFYAYFQPYFSDRMKTVFEVGCYKGASLLPFFKRGWKVAGVDFGSEGIAFGKQKTGIDRLFAGGLEKLEALNEQADLIISNHVVEHFDDVQAQLRRIYALLAPGGLFVVCVPGIYWWSIYGADADLLHFFQTAHCWQFSLRTLTEVMARVGFERVYGDEMIKAVFRKVPAPVAAVALPLSAPSAEYRKVMSFLRRVERFRWAYRLRVACYGALRNWARRVGLRGRRKSGQGTEG